jgi:hypothetical protein
MPRREMGGSVRNVLFSHVYKNVQTYDHFRKKCTVLSGKARLLEQAIPRKNNEVRCKNVDLFTCGFVSFFFACVLDLEHTCL